MALERTEPPAGVSRVEGLRDDRFVIGGTAHDGALLIWPEGLETLHVATVDQLGEAHFDRVASLRPSRDVLLIGSGPSMAWPDMSLVAALRQRGLGPEIMDSRAAARTYNLLAGEGRQVAALLLPLRPC